jgi:hypothetical protein
MSISMGIVGGLAGAPLSQRTAEVDRADRESAATAHETKADSRAEQAAGIGQTAEDSEATERDADGRRPWEHPLGKKPAADPGETPSIAETPARPKDPSGERGSALDLVG